MKQERWHPDLVSVIDELPLWSGPFGMRLLDSIRMTRVRCALDIGSGLGFPVCEIAMRFGAETRVFGIDPWKEALDRIGLKRRVCEIGNLAITCGVAENLPFPDGSFDLLVSNNGINNVQDLEKTLAECRRVAASGAQFVFTMNLDGTMLEFYTVYEDVLRSHGMFREIDAMHAHIRAKRPPLDDVLNAVSGADFRVADVAHDSFGYRFRDGTTMLRHFVIRLAFLDPWQEIVAPEHRTTVFREIETRLNAIASKHGELELSVPFVVVDCHAGR